MQDKVIQLEVAVPDRLVVDERSISVQLPLTTGYLEVLPGHAPMLAELGTGVLSFTSPDKSIKKLALDSGTVEILPDRVRVLASKAERSEGIDRERSSQALERASKLLKQTSLDIDVERAQKAIERARSRLAATG